MEGDSWRKQIAMMGIGLRKLITSLGIALVMAAVGLVAIFYSHNIGEKTFLGEIVRECGFALMVSASIWFFFEAYTRSEAEKEFVERTKVIALNVFNAMLGRELPRELADEVKLSFLEVKLIREDFSANYILNDASYKDNNGEIKNYISLACDIKFTIKNIYNDDVIYDIAASLPNPFHQELKDNTKVEQITATRDDMRDVHLDLDKADRDFRRRINEAREESHITYLAGRETLRPGHSLTVRVQSIMAKEEEDTELLELTYPANGLSIDIVDNGGVGGRIVKARTIHRVEIEAKPWRVAENRWSMSLKRYVLPHQGVLIWWKKAPTRKAVELPAETRSAMSRSPKVASKGP